MLSIEKLRVAYGKVQAVHEASLEVREGQTVSLVGLNGAGKSSLLRAIAGIHRASGGRVVFKGREIHALPATEVARLGVAMVLEGRSTFRHMTVRENLLLGGYARHDRPAVAKEVRRLIERFPVLGARLDQAAGTLSGGEQQMLVIARALLMRPSLLLLDEPSLGLAPRVVTEIFRLVRELRKEGMTILLVEQNARQALALSDHAYVMETGRIVLEGRDLANDARVREAYLGL